MTDCLRPHGQQHARLPCPSLSPRVCSNSCPLSQWCHPTISSSDAPFSSCPQSFPASESFPMNQLFTSGGSPCSPRDSQESSPTPQFKSINSSAFSLLYGPTLTSICVTTGKTIALTRWTFVGKVTSLFFNMLSRLVITFLSRSKRLLFHGCNHHLQWFWSPQK